MKTTKILPPRIFQLALLAIAAIHFLLPLWFMYHSPIRFIGIIPIFIGSYLNIYTDQLIKKKHTTIKPFEEPSAFIEYGPFRYSRNPIYLGMVLILVGAGFISGSVLTFLVPIGFAILVFFLYIKPEEQILEARFGETYTNYKKRVNCWI